MRTIAAIVCSLLVAAAAFAKANSEEKKLMVKLGQANAAEVDLAKLVEPKATNPDVKAYAKTMIEDHGKGFEKLETLAKQEHVTLKSGMDAEHKEFAAKLSNEHGAAHDRLYIEEMVQDHTKDKKDVEEALTKIKDPDLKAWTGEQLKTIEHHLHMAEELRAKLKK